MTSLGTKHVSWFILVRVARDFVWDITRGLVVAHGFRDRKIRQDPRRIVLLEAIASVFYSSENITLHNLTTSDVLIEGGGCTEVLKNI